MKTARILLGLGMIVLTIAVVALPAKAAGFLQNSKITLSDSQPSTSATHTYNFTISSAGNVKTITFTYCDNASGSCTAPPGMSLTSASLDTFAASGSDNTFTLASAATGVITMNRPDGTGEAWSADDTVNIIFDTITNHAIGDCNAASNNSSDTCYVRMATKNNADVALDEGTATVTVVAAITVTARIDPTFTFLVEGVGASTVSNGVTTSVGSAYNTLPFGNLTSGTPRYAGHKLTVTNNTESGYTISMKMTTQMTGVYTANNIDPYAYNSVTWAAPVAWTNPGGSTKNVNTAWIGANTSDTDVESGAYTSGLFGPVPTGGSSYNIVMQDSDTDDGSTSVSVYYGVEANTYQPADSYTGTLLYNALPTY